MSTMKKSEMLSAIKNDVVSRLNLEDLGAIQIGVGLWAIPSIEIDGNVSYAKVAVSAANPTGTEKVPAFDIDAAVEDWELEVAERERKQRLQKRLKPQSKEKGGAIRLFLFLLIVKILTVDRALQQKCIKKKYCK